MLRYLDDADLAGKTVFVRADLNVPLDDAGRIADDTRITATLETINCVIQGGGKLILASHLGRPDGKRADKYSLKPVAEKLRTLTGLTVTLAPDCIGDEVKKLVANLQPREILLLENLRFHAEEEANDPEFARQLAEFCDVYVNDAFATAHRAHASTAAMVPLVKERICGFAPKRELEFFDKALLNPARPLVAILGGAKVSTKIKVIHNVSKRADVILIGGAMANTFFKAQGYEVGKSLVEVEQVAVAKEILEKLRDSQCKLMLPIDVTIADKFATGAKVVSTEVENVPSDQMIVDIGPKTIELFAQQVHLAKTVLWNGPLGAFEIEEFSRGTFDIAHAMAKSSAVTVVGGGDTDLALHRTGLYDKMTYVSTAGGAFLKLLEGAKLPAIEALRN